MYNLFEYKNNIYFKNNDDIYIKSFHKFKKETKVDINWKKIKKTSDIKSLNWSFKIICDKCENYWDDWDVILKSIKLKDNNFVYYFLTSKITNSDKIMHIKYSKKDSILIINYIMNVLNYCEGILIFKDYVIIIDNLSLYDVFFHILKNESVTLCKKTDDFSVIYFNSAILGFYKHTYNVWDI